MRVSGLPSVTNVDGTVNGIDGNRQPLLKAGRTSGRRSDDGFRACMVYRLGGYIPINACCACVGDPMTRKAGGRDGRGRVRVPVSELKLPDAAADPAAVTYCEECGHPPNDGERIRELEAEIERQRDGWQAARDRWHWAEARAERAEARMKELETLIKGKFTTLGELLHARDERSLS